MSSKDMERVARRIVSLEKRHEGLARARQLEVSSVQMPDGSSQSIADGVSAGTDAVVGVGRLDGQVDDLGGVTDTEAEHSTSVPGWIEVAGEQASVAWDSTQFAVDLARQIEVALVEVAEEAASAQTTADGMNRRRRGVTEPVAPERGWNPGDQWVVDVLDPGGDPVPTEVRVWNGTAFVHESTLTGELLVVGPGGIIRLADGVVSASALAAKAIDGMTITGALLRTAASGQRMQFDVNGLQAFRADGTQMAALRPDTGGMRIDGTFIAGIAGTATGYRSYLSNLQLAIMDAGASGAIAGNPSSTVTPGNLRLAVSATGGDPARVANYQTAETSLFEGVTGSGPFRSTRVGLDGIQVTSADGPGGLGQADAFLGTQRISGVRSSYAAVDQVKTDKISSRTGPVAIEAGSAGDVTIQGGSGKKVRMLSPLETTSVVNVDGGMSAPYAMAAGMATRATTIPNGTGATVAVTFPANRFTESPIVVMAASSGRITAGHNNITKDGFVASFDNWSPAGAAGPIYGHWTATQMTKASASG